MTEQSQDAETGDVKIGAFLFGNYDTEKKKIENEELDEETRKALVDLIDSGKLDRELNISRSEVEQSPEALIALKKKLDESRLASRLLEEQIAKRQAKQQAETDKLLAEKLLKERRKRKRKEAAADEDFDLEEEGEDTLPEFVEDEISRLERKRAELQKTMEMAVTQKQMKQSASVFAAGATVLSGEPGGDMATDADLTAVLENEDELLQEMVEEEDELDEDRKDEEDEGPEKRIQIGSGILRFTEIFGPEPEKGKALERLRRLIALSKKVTATPWDKASRKQNSLSLPKDWRSTLPVMLDSRYHNLLNVKVHLEPVEPLEPLSGLENVMKNATISCFSEDRFLSEETRAIAVRKAEDAEYSDEEVLGRDLPGRQEIPTWARPLVEAEDNLENLQKDIVVAGSMDYAVDIVPWEENIIWDTPAKIRKQKLEENPFNRYLPEITLDNLSDEIIWDDKHIPRSLRQRREVVLNLNDFDLAVRTVVPHTRPKRLGKEHRKDRFDLSLDDVYLRNTAQTSGSIVHHERAMKLARFPLLLRPDDLGPDFCRPKLSLPKYSPVDLITASRSLDKAKDTSSAQSRLSLSPRFGKLFLVEFMEQHPIFLLRKGMASNFVHYTKGEPKEALPFDDIAYRKDVQHEEVAPFLGELEEGQVISSFENNLYRAPVARHQPKSTDFLVVVVREKKKDENGEIREVVKLVIREINTTVFAGQQHPTRTVPSPGSEDAVLYLKKRAMKYLATALKSTARKGKTVNFHKIHKPIKYLVNAYVLKAGLRTIAEEKRGTDEWKLKPSDARPKLTDDRLKELVTLEDMVCYESMLRGMKRLQKIALECFAQIDPACMAEAVEVIEGGRDIDNLKMYLCAIRDEMESMPWHLTSTYLDTRHDKCSMDIKKGTSGFKPIKGGDSETDTILAFCFGRRVTGSRVLKGLENEAIQAYTGKLTGTENDLRKLSMEETKRMLLEIGYKEAEIAKMKRWERVKKITLHHSQKGGVFARQMRNQDIKKEATPVLRTQLFFLRNKLKHKEAEYISDDDTTGKGAKQRRTKARRMEKDRPKTYPLLYSLERFTNRENVKMVNAQELQNEALLDRDKVEKGLQLKIERWSDKILHMGFLRLKTLVWNMEMTAYTYEGRRKEAKIEINLLFAKVIDVVTELPRYAKWKEPKALSAKRAKKDGHVDLVTMFQKGRREKAYRSVAEFLGDLEKVRGFAREYAEGFADESAKQQHIEEVDDLIETVKAELAGLAQDLEEIEEKLLKDEKSRKDADHAQEGIPPEFSSFLSRIGRIVSELYQDSRSQPFRSAVDPKENPEYAKTISHPMYLYRLKKKVQDLKYFRVDDFKADMTLIRDNARRYFQNREGKEQIVRDAEWLWEHAMNSVDKDMDEIRREEKVIAAFAKDHPRFFRSFRRSTERLQNSKD